MKTLCGDSCLHSTCISLERGTTSIYPTQSQPLRITVHNGHHWVAAATRSLQSSSLSSKSYLPKKRDFLSRSTTSKWLRSTLLMEPFVRDRLKNKTRITTLGVCETPHTTRTIRVRDLRTPYSHARASSRLRLPISRQRFDRQAIPFQ
jgi:hypothetical protein